jgi:hypothetical protein
MLPRLRAGAADRDDGRIAPRQVLRCEGGRGGGALPGDLDRIQDGERIAARRIRKIDDALDRRQRPAFRVAEESAVRLHAEERPVEIKATNLDVILAFAGIGMEQAGFYDFPLRVQPKRIFDRAEVVLELHQLRGFVPRKEQRAGIAHRLGRHGVRAIRRYSRAISASGERR